MSNNKNEQNEIENTNISIVMNDLNEEYLAEHIWEAFKCQLQSICRENQKEHEETTQYISLLNKILSNGESNRNDRTGTGTTSLFGCRMEFDISESIPILTTKKVLTKKVIGELLWMISGSTNVEHLKEKGINFWNANSTREFLDGRGLFDNEEGDLGPVYGFQWRHFGAPYIDCNTDYSGMGLDQLTEVINTIKNNPTCRRIVMTAWNPFDIDKMALPPCHMTCQFYVRNGEYLDCQLYQRSADMFLGVPFNIMSYSCLVYMIAHITNLKPGRFIHVLGDAHIYSNHIEQVFTLISRVPKPFPTLHFNRTSDEIQSIDDFVESDFVIENYQHHGFVKAKMAV